MHEGQLWICFMDQLHQSIPTQKFIRQGTEGGPLRKSDEVKTLKSGLFGQFNGLIFIWKKAGLTFKCVVSKQNSLNLNQVRKQWRMWWFYHWIDQTTLELEREAREDDLPVENEFQFSIPIISRIPGLRQLSMLLAYITHSLECFWVKKMWSRNPEPI